MNSEVFRMVISGIGVLIAVFVAIQLFKFRRTMIGSIFKGYYAWSMLAMIIYGLGFFTEYLSLFGVSDALAEDLHHVFLILAGIIFAVVGIYLPQEAAKYMDAAREKQQQQS